MEYWSDGVMEKRISNTPILQYSKPHVRRNTVLINIHSIFNQYRSLVLNLRVQSSLKKSLKSPFEGGFRGM